MPRSGLCSIHTIQCRPAPAKSLVGRSRFDRGASFRVSSIESWGEEAMRQFYFKAMIEKSAGEHADWKAVDAAILQAAAMAKEVAPHWHQRLAALRRAGEIKSSPTEGTLDELLSESRWS